MSVYDTLAFVETKKPKVKGVIKVVRSVCSLQESHELHSEHAAGQNFYHSRSNSV